jgi:hypothetical protein
MPLASWYSLHFYGQGAGAMVTQGESAVVAGMAGYAQANQVTTATSSMPLAKATRLVNSPAVIQGAGSVPQALPKARARPSAVIQVNQLSQDDVTGAVLESAIEDGMTLRQALRVLLAVAAGKTDIADLGGGAATVTFRDVNDTKNRVVATMSGSERTAVTKNTT